MKEKISENLQENLKKKIFQSATSIKAQKYVFDCHQQMDLMYRLLLMEKNCVSCAVSRRKKNFMDFCVIQLTLLALLCVEIGDE